MSDIKNITLYLNDKFKAGSFQGKPFQKGNFSGIADLVERTDEDKDLVYSVPVILSADGEEGTDVVINDRLGFQLYHRIIKQKTEDAENEDTFGDGNDKSITFEMVVIILSDKFTNQINASEYITALILEIPRTINPTLITGSQFNKCEITVKDAITNTKEVIEQEYKRDDYNIKQSYVALSLEYEVKLNYSAGCFTLCE